MRVTAAIGIGPRLNGLMRCGHAPLTGDERKFAQDREQESPSCARFLRSTSTARLDLRLLCHPRTRVAIRNIGVPTPQR